MKKIIWWLFAGTRGGETRIKIVEKIKERPYNSNQLAEILKMDYKTIRHHINVLLENRIITATGDRYGTVYFLSDEMEENYSVLEDIIQKIKGS